MLRFVPLAELASANLIRANSGANLSHANLNGADLSRAIIGYNSESKPIFCNTIMPDGRVRNDDY